MYKSLSKGKRVGLALVLGGLIIGFQNCSQVKFAQVASPVGPTNTTTNTIKAIQPAFAVRGMNCMACHGFATSNIITDFGWGSPNFGANIVGKPVAPTFFQNGNRTAFNDGASGNNQNGWQSWTDSTPNTWTNFAVSGSVIIPKVTIPDSGGSQSSSQLFGITGGTTLASMMETPGLIPAFTDPNTGLTSPTSPSMVAGVVSPGNPTIEVSSISITYPSQSEILALVPPQDVGLEIVAAPITVSGLSTSTMSGLGPDPTGTFITNNGTVECFGDVVIKGALFLNNLNIQTDSNGCRLYVSKTVFIQGFINYVNGNGSNLQITSSSAILMGFSALRIGALNGAQPDKGDPSTVREYNQTYLKQQTPGGPWGRFAASLDQQYNPSMEPINGVDELTFFDNIARDAVSIGIGLLDAGDAAFVQQAQNYPNQETVVDEGGANPGDRVVINFSGLLLNAPHVHSRYFGNLSGVIISDVSFLARNPQANVADETFSYDHTFDNVQIVLPALTTTILSVTP